MLELSRAESEQMYPIAAEPVHVNSVLKHVTQNFIVIQSDFQFDMKFGDDEAYVSMPSSYLEQIIIIIMDNAVKYTKEVNKYICIESSLQSGKLQFV